ILATMVSTCHAFPVPPLYAANAIRATVVDATAGSPIEGAVVVAVWQLQTMSGEGPRLQVSEAVTDRDGRFVIPGWGPKFRQPLAAERDYFTRHPLDPQTVRSELVNAVFDRLDVLGRVHNEHGGHDDGRARSGR